MSPSLEEKRALLAARAQPQAFPLAFAQERLWFLDQLTPGTPLYTIACAVPVKLRLEPPALERSFNALVRRHETLRTTFPAVDGKPVQLVAPALHIPLTVRDLSDRRDPSGEAQRIAAEEARQPFDLARGPLLRATLLQLGPADNLLLITMHHIVSDGWSLSVLGRELWECYTADLAGRPPALDTLPIQYADYAVWQRDWLQGEALERQLEYWRAALADLPVLELPTDRPRPVVQTFTGAAEPLTVPASVTSQLKALGQREGCTLFMTLLAGFQALLGRYSDQEDVSVGTYIAGRSRAETEGLIGFFINTLVLRGDLSGDPTFRELMGRARETALGAYANQDVPFPKLVEALQPQRDQSRNPLFQVVLHLFNAPGSGGDEPALELGAPPGGAVFDLILELMESPTGLTGRIQYNADLLEPETIRRMATHFNRLLAAAAADPDRRVAELPLLAPTERRWLVSDLNDTAAPLPLDEGVVELFAAEVARAPDAPAFRAGGETLSYRDLDRRSDALAGRMRAYADGIVAVSLERSLDLAVALLAVFKAGAAYLPLDPGLPPRRRDFILDDSGAAAVLTRSGLEPRAADAARAAGGLAYVIYTSGSTGRPKGVALEHAQVINRLHWMWREHPFAPGEVACVRTPMSFVDSLWELLGGLLRGVPAVIVGEEAGKDPDALIDALAEGGVTRIWLVPTLLRALLETGPDLARRLPRLGFWVSTGETLEPELDQRFRAELPDAILYNLYGTSEAWDVTWHVPEREAERRARIPIGRPIANMRTYVLDRHGEPVPVGVPGDLWVGGIGLAREYLNRADLTRETFKPDPFSREPGARMYRTGDRARHRADGVLEYLGRDDHQVKLRGFRVELGEVEAALREHPAVQEAAVVVHRERLVAHVATRAQAPALAAELRRHLAERLPAQMLPAAFVTSAALPLTPSGKLDRLALPAPDGERPELDRAHVAPRTAAERVVAEVWADVLGLDRVGVNDDFFAELGGHSLLGTQVVSRIRDAFQVKLPLGHLFEAPTVAGMVTALVSCADARRIERTAEVRLRVAEMSDEDVATQLATRNGG
jgi:amino acid adenylation domain-containing protein